MMKNSSIPKPNPMKPLLLLCSVMILALTGCKQVLMWRYGIHKPQEEKVESIESFLKKHSFPTTNVLVFKDSTNWSAFLRDSLYQRNILTTLFFSPNGLLDQFRDTNQCQWSGGFQARLLRKDTLYHCDTNYRFASLMSMVKPLTPATTVDTAGADYYAVVTWGSFLGTYNERLFGIREAMAANPDVTIVPVFLCIDMLREWNLTKDQVLSFRDD